MTPNRKRVLVAALALLVIASGAAAYTTIFTAGSGTAYEADSGLVVETGVDHGLDDANPFNDSDTVYVDGVEFSAGGAANVTVDQFRGTWTNVSSVDASSHDLTIDPDDKPASTIGGSVTALAYRDDIDLGDDDVALTYAADGDGNITVSGLDANTDWAAASTDGNAVDSGTTSSTGAATIEVESASDESLILFEPHAPDVDNSSASPDETALNSRDVTLSVPVSDAEFDTEQGDSVSVDFYVDGSQAGSETISSNQTVEHNESVTTGGAHTWHVEATDEYGQTTVSDTFGFESPATLSIRNETDTSQLVTDPNNVTIRWIGEDRIYQNETSDGTLNMTGLPTEDFIVQVDSSDNYHSRTVYIDSLYDQQDVYLLNTTVSSTESRFTLEDPTGQFNERTLLYISKPIERNGSVQYETIYADRFGVEGVTARLEDGERYRLHIESPDGVTQDLGPYRANIAETVTVRPGGPAVEIDDFEEGWGTAADLDNDTLSVRYEDPENLTESVMLNIHERGNASNQLVANQTFFDANTVDTQYTLTRNQTEKAWVVNYVIDRGDGEFVVSETVSNRADAVLPELSDEWRQIIGIGALFMFAGVFSVLNRGVGAIMTGVTGGLLWWTGWLEGATAGAAVVIYLFVAVLYNIYISGGP